MALNPDAKKMPDRQNYNNHWHTNLMNTCRTNPLYCCFALWCAPCASYSLRKRALKNDMSKYKCCAGYEACSGRCGERWCPRLCLCMEVFCCVENSVAYTRYLLEDEYEIQMSECDNCITCFVSCCQKSACICSIVVWIIGGSEILDPCILTCLANRIYCTVCPCMQTQHKIELDNHDGKGPMATPPIQRMSRLDKKIPPTGPSLA